MNLGEFLNATFTKIGIPVEDGALKDIVTKAATIEIADELAGKHSSSYLTVDAAKNNPDLMKHFYGPALNGVDSAILNIVKEFGYSDDVKTELETEKNTYKKLGLLSKKIKELETQKLGSSKSEKDDLNKKISEYENQIKEIKVAHTTELDTIKNSHNETLKDVYLTQFLSSQNYASPLASEENYLLPKSKINSILKDKNLQISLADKGFVLKTAEGTDYFENNSKVDFKTFAEKALADNKFTTISEPQNPQQTTTVVSGNLDRSKLSGLAQYQAAAQDIAQNV